MIGKTVSPYRIIEKLGSGGIGVVYKARPQAPGGRAVPAIPLGAAPVPDVNGERVMTFCPWPFRLLRGALPHGALLLGILAAASLQAVPQQGAITALPSETPAQFKPTNDGFDHERRDVMIPMRDGVKLHTVIMSPKGARRAPILLTRTPYNATTLTSHAPSAHLGTALWGYDNATEVIVEGGYIRVVQDVRGKYGSEGEYVMNRPVRGPQNPTQVDHATDTYDTIDWLVKNIPETNGKVGSSASRTTGSCR